MWHLASSTCVSPKIILDNAQHLTHSCMAVSPCGEHHQVTSSRDLADAISFYIFSQLGLGGLCKDFVSKLLWGPEMVTFHGTAVPRSFSTTLNVRDIHLSKGVHGYNITAWWHLYPGITHAYRSGNAITVKL